MCTVCSLVPVFAFLLLYCTYIKYVITSIVYIHVTSAYRVRCILENTTRFNNRVAINYGRRLRFFLFLYGNVRED